ncbi:MAG: D-hexose-6-phosphate mutarotase [Betaproteobacteria bacterium]|jgi:glucose-6-phosphate 1-epimerase
MNAIIECTDFRGLPALRLTEPSGGSAVITDFGAQVVSWMPEPGDERLYLSEAAVFDGSLPIRGGIPVIFPQFGTLGTGRRHGFARTANWGRTANRAEPEFAMASWHLSHASPSLDWPHPFSLEITVSLCRNRLDVELFVVNEGSGAMSFTTALHTYLQVDDVQTCSLIGLEGCRYVDQTTANTMLTDTDSELRIGAEVDRIYLKTPEALELRTPGKTLQIGQRSFPDTVVWNPWVERCRGFTDMPEKGFLRMLCVEAAATTPVQLDSLGEWSARQSLMIP